MGKIIAIVNFYDSKGNMESENRELVFDGVTKSIKEV